jgi:hypothetical protein
MFARIPGAEGLSLAGSVTVAQTTKKAAGMFLSLELFL